MADSFITLADLVKINDQNLADIEVTDLLNDAPLISRLAADVASNGTDHKYVKETGAPTVGFRLPNTGRENSKSADTLVTIALKILDASFSVDKALATEYKRGQAAFVAREARRHLKEAFSIGEKQLINGVVGQEADGFTGLKDNAGLDALADEMVINAGGTTPATASSAWLFRTNDDGSDVMLITGMEGNIEIGETVEQAIEDTVNGGRFTGLYTSILAWLGLQVGSARSVARITNLTEDAGAGLTDDFIAEAISAFPASRKPNLLACSRRSLRQLRESRTATNATGAPAPFPAESHGVEIVVTDSIPDTDALTA